MTNEDHFGATLTALISTLDGVTNELTHRSRWGDGAEAVSTKELEARALVKKAARMLSVLNVLPRKTCEHCSN